jgi:eukaryotic-like serine/threonine-protein kinase
VSEFQTRLQEVLGAQYRIERELGGGGMSRVFLAEEVELARKVVVKVLPPDMAAGLNAERFRREIQLAASLQHPHIVPLIASGRTGDVVWYTMPFIEGESLRAKLARERELPVGDAVRILRDVVDALSYAHEHGVVHRDIKPDNVLITGRHAVVTDFGVAKAVSASTGESSLTSVGIALGTPAYMSPEQASADPNVDHRADIYSVGAMAYEMLAGAPPFSGPPPLVLAAHVTQAPDPVSRRRASMPPALASLIMRALEKKPADRWQSASELHQQFELMATPSGGAQPTSAVMATTATSRLSPLARNVAIAFALGVVSVAAWVKLKPASGVDEVVLDPRVVAVLPFRVAGADPSLHYLRQGMLDLLQAKLTGEGGPRAADARSVLAAFRDAGGTDANDVADEGLTSIARKVGAARVVQGSIVGPPDHIVLSASLIEMPDGRNLAQTTVQGPKDSLFVMVDRLAAQLLALGAGASQQQLSALTTTSLDALRAYLDGVAAYRRGAFVTATTLLTRAVQHDSTFALALSALVEADGWMDAPIDMDRVRRLGWQYRDRLAAKDQLILSIRLGSRFPRETDASEKLADRERATQEMPDNAEAWYYLGDHLYHDGTIADIPNAMSRAKEALLRAVQLDSLYGAPTQHLLTAAIAERDTATAAQWLKRMIALDTSDAAVTGMYRWGVASLRGEVAALQQQIARMDSTPDFAFLLLTFMPLDSAVVANRERLFASGMRHASSSAERLAVLRQQLFALWNAGRPDEASRVADLMRAEGEPAWAVAVYQSLGRMLLGGDWVTPIRTELPYRNPEILFAKAVTEIARGEAISSDGTVQAMRRAAGQGEAANVETLRMAAVLDAWNAVSKRSPDATARLEAADSAVRGWRQRDEISSLFLGRAWAELGRFDRALLAIRRRHNALGTPVNIGLAEALRLEGKIAEKAGDRPGAILAYERYLLLRRDPEPVMKPQRDSVVAELAAIMRQR